MEAASGSAIPTKLCVLDAVTPAKRHRAQQFTGGKNIGVPATLARNGVVGDYACEVPITAQNSCLDGWSRAFATIQRSFSSSGTPRPCRDTW